MAGPNQGEVYDGYRFMGGNPQDQANWQQAAPVDVSAEYGAGARRLPNGTVERVGPRGGVTKIAEAAAGGEAVGKLTEDQGKSGGYARLMADAERSYQQALDEGFNPTGLGAGIANFTDNIPGLGGVGNFIRNDAGDRARQAELQWTDAQLKAMSGAASPEPEVVRNQITNFARPGQNFNYIGDRLRQARTTAFQSAKVRAGPAAADISYPELSFVDKINPETGLPSYPEITQLTRDIREVPTPEGGYGGGPDQTPGSGPETAIDYTAVPPDQLITLLANGGWVRQGNGEPYQVAPGSVRRASSEAGDQAVAPGVVRRDENTPEGAVADRRDDWGIVRGPDAFMRGAADALSLEWADEAGAATNAAIGRGNGETFRDRYRNNLQVERAIDKADGEDMLGVRRAGQLVGTGLGLATTAPKLIKTATTAGRPIVNALMNAGRVSAAGAATGAIAGAGDTEGGLQERGQNALTGGTVGAVLAPVVGAAARPVLRTAISAAKPVGRLLASGANALGVPGARQVAERLTPNALREGLDRFAERVPQSGLDDRMAALQDLGIEPTLVDLIDDSGRGTMRALSTRQTPARQAAREFADERATGLQDRISKQARRTVSDDARTPMEMTDELTARRGRQADEAFGAVRGDMISPDRGVLEALRTPAMRPAIDEAITSALNRGDNDTAALLKNLTDDALEYGADAKITVGMADRIARSLNGRAQALQRAGNNDAASAQFALAERLRGGARTQSPGYDTALRQFSDESGKIDAVALGEQFMTMEADQFANAVAKLSPEEVQIAQAAARRAIERQAGTQGAAPGVAQRLAGGREQGIRSQALLGDPSRMQAAMGAERDALMAARGVSPAQGSPTNVNQQDTMAAAGEAVGAVRDVATGNIPAILSRLGQRITSRGFNDAEAEAIVMAAIDPRRTREVLDMLATRIPRREARSLVRVIQRSSAQSAGANSSPQ